VPVIVDAAPNGSIGARPCAAIGPPATLYLQRGMAHAHGPGCLAGGSVIHDRGSPVGGVEAGGSRRDTCNAQIRSASVRVGVVVVAKYLVCQASKSGVKATWR
jgi:hypothetical protein